jgi:anti-sigma factor RsiW
LSERPYITCRELIEFLMDYLDGALSAERRAEVDRHLAVCPSCVEYMRSYQEAVKMGKVSMRADDSAAPGDVPEELLRAVLGARKGGG